MSKYMRHIFPENFIKSTRSRDFLSKKAKCVLITIVSSNINEVIRAVLNHKQAQNAHKRTKIKNAPKNI